MTYPNPYASSTTNKRTPNLHQRENHFRTTTGNRVTPANTTGRHLAPSPLNANESPMERPKKVSRKTTMENEKEVLSCEDPDGDNYEQVNGTPQDTSRNLQLAQDCTDESPTKTSENTKFARYLKDMETSTLVAILKEREPDIILHNTSSSSQLELESEVFVNILANQQNCFSTQAGRTRGQSQGITQRRANTTTTLQNDLPATGNITTTTHPNLETNENVTSPPNSTTVHQQISLENLVEENYKPKSTKLLPLRSTLAAQLKAIRPLYEAITLQILEDTKTVHGRQSSLKLWEQGFSGPFQTDPEEDTDTSSETYIPKSFRLKKLILRYPKKLLDDESLKTVIEELENDFLRKKQEFESYASRCTKKLQTMALNHCLRKRCVSLTRGYINLISTLCIHYRSQPE